MCTCLYYIYVYIHNTHTYYVFIFDNFNRNKIVVSECRHFDIMYAYIRRRRNMRSHVNNNILLSLLMVIEIMNTQQLVFNCMVN